LACKNWQGEPVPSAKVKVCTVEVSQEARDHEDNARIENRPPDLYRQVDAQDSVVIEERSIGTGNCAAVSGVCPSVCSPEIFAISNPKD
jgi:hypothetical protein